MAHIEFTKGEQAVIAKKIQSYFREELHGDIGQFDALFLLGGFAEEDGVYFCSRYLYEAQKLIGQKIDGMTEAIYELEKVRDYRR